MLIRVALAKLMLIIILAVKMESLFGSQMVIGHGGLVVRIMVVNGLTVMLVRIHSQTLIALVV